MIWTYGVRNSFGLAIHPVTGDLWETENGDDSWDEVNIFPAGSNSGWIQLIGPPERFAEFKQIEMDSEDGMDNKDFPPDKLAADADEAQQRMFILEGSTYVPPVFAWKHPVAVTSIGFVTDDTLGASSSNTAWLGTVLTDSLYRYPLAADGSGFDFAGDTGLNDRVDDNTEKGDVGESAKYVVGTGFGVVTGIVHAPDGLLYVSSISAGAVYRIGPADTVGGASPAPTRYGGAQRCAIRRDGRGHGRHRHRRRIEVRPGRGDRAGRSRRSADLREPIDRPAQPDLPGSDHGATSTVVAPGASETLEFKAPDPGEYPFVCTLHPGMGGTLVVEAG